MSSSYKTILERSKERKTRKYRKHRKKDFGKKKKSIFTSDEDYKPSDTSSILTGWIGGLLGGGSDSFGGGSSGGGGASGGW